MISVIKKNKFCVPKWIIFFNSYVFMRRRVRLSDYRQLFSAIDNGIGREDMQTKKLKIIRNIIMIATAVLGFIFWLAIPYEFKNSTFFHFGTGEYGTKLGALLLLFLPLFALIPNKDENKVHTDDSVEREKLVEEFALREAKRQVMIAFLLGATVIAIMGIAALIL